MTWFIYQSNINILLNDLFFFKNIIDNDVIKIDLLKINGYLFKEKLIE